MSIFICRKHFLHKLVHKLGGDGGDGGCDGSCRRVPPLTVSADLNHFEDPPMFLLHCLLDKDEDDDDDGEVTLTLHAQSPQQQTSFWFQVYFGVVVAITHTSDPGCGGLS